MFMVRQRPNLYHTFIPQFKVACLTCQSQEQHDDSIADADAETIPADIGGDRGMMVDSQQLTPEMAKPVGLTLPSDTQPEDEDMVGSPASKESSDVVEAHCPTSNTVTAEPTPAEKTPCQPDRTVPTPCRAPEPGMTAEEVGSPVPSPTVLEVSSPESTIPSLDDATASKPKAQVMRISEAAADARLRRVFEPSKRTGDYKVSDAILAQYKKPGKSRKSLQMIFETCGYDKAGLPQQHSVKIKPGNHFLCSNLDLYFWMLFLSVLII